MILSHKNVCPHHTVSYGTYSSSNYKPRGKKSIAMDKWRRQSIKKEPEITGSLKAVLFNESSKGVLLYTNLFPHCLRYFAVDIGGNFLQQEGDVTAPLPHAEMH